MKICPASLRRSISDKCYLQYTTVSSLDLLHCRFVWFFFFLLLARQSLNDTGNQEIWKTILKKEDITFLFHCSLP